MKILMKINILVAKQKKLPEGLQKGIIKRMKKKEVLKHYKVYLHS